MANTSLTKAKTEKNDEFYTSKADIEKEIVHYVQHFKDKNIYCNCDDPFESNFPQVLALNFKKWGLNSLTCTCYGTSKVAGTQFTLDNWDDELKPSEKRKAYMFRITKEDGDRINSLDDLKQVIKAHTKRLDGDGDFRSKECLELLDQSDIVITNPPFSLFREFIATLTEHNKQFLVIGNTNAITYKEVFPLIKENKLWLGVTNFNVGMWYEVPDEYPCQKVVDGKRVVRVSTSCWYTNLTHSKRNEKLILFKTYNPEEYPKYDNYNAIEVSKVCNIPVDYDGVMGVPITFIDKYNPEQFEIIGKIDSGSIDTYNVANPVINGVAHFKRIAIKRRG